MVRSMCGTRYSPPASGSNQWASGSGPCGLTNRGAGAGDGAIVWRRYGLRHLVLLWVDIGEALKVGLYCLAGMREPRLESPAI